MRRLTPCLLAVLPVFAGPYESTVQPFLRKNCAACHGAKAPGGNLDLAALAVQPAEQSLQQRERWERIVQRVRAGEMPPKGAPRPVPGESSAVVSWLESEFDRMDRAAKPDPGRVTVRRLNRFEYSNSVRDLTGVDLDAGRDLPPDAYGYGFDNIGDVLSLSPALAERYLKNAERIAASAIPDGASFAPTMDRYLAERMDQDRQLHLTVDHVFPVDGRYTLRSAWYQALRNGTKVRLRLMLDGKEVASQVLPFYYEMDRGLEARDLAVTAGRHRVEAVIEVLPEPPYKGSLPYLEYIQIYGPSKVTAKPAIACGQGDCVKQTLERFAPRAYRRPVTREEMADLMSVADRVRERGGSAPDAARAGLQAILVSPNFLFRIERDAMPGAHRLSDWELASRLSYFLWSSIPDAELTELAAKSRLREPSVLAAQVGRMLRDGKARAFVESFAGQWLQTRNLQVLKPDRARFPEFDSLLRDDMRTETELFFEAVLREDRSLLDFLDARFTYLNERLARFYGIAGVNGPEFRRVELDGAQRGGVLTHASVLTVSSYPTRTSPVIRGKWLLENILNSPPPPPPPDVPPLDEQGAGNTGSMRQQLEKHRTNAVCAGCHGRMDPLGFGLENYDAIGKWRTMDGTFPIDASGELPGGKKFAGPAELKILLRERKADFTRRLAGKMLTYALGRGLETYDRAAVRRIVSRVESQGHRFSSLIRGVVESAPFQMRRGEVESTQKAGLNR